MKKIMDSLLIVLMTAVLQADGLYIDFSTSSSAVEAGYVGYRAAHEQPATFTTQTFSAFETTISITPAWASGATAAAMQMCLRAGGYTGDYEDLVIDWIGTDTREPGNPLTLTISGLPEGSYSWLSYHHDSQDQTGRFDLTIYDADGPQTLSNIDITNGTGVAFDDVTKLPATIVSNGTDDIQLVFTQVSIGGNVSDAFFLMNGFELEINDPCRNDAPVVEGDEALLAIVGKSVSLHVTVSDDGKPYMEGCDPGDPQVGTSYPLEFQWAQQSGPGTAVFSPASADQQAVAVTFPLQGIYELSLDVSDAPVGVTDRRTTRRTITVQVIEALEGDIDFNQAVNLDDLMYIANQWLFPCGGDLFCADLDNSGLVTLDDFSLVASNWMTIEADVVINEFVASNRDGLADGNGDRPDWIELYNKSNEAFSLEGWFLTDDAENLQKWAFPAGTILSGEDYLIVFASGQSVDDYVDPAGYRHTNFALDKEGEYLALVSPDGEVVHEYKPAYPSQEADISYGLWYDRVRYFATPTPGGTNSDAFLGFTDKPNYDADRGFYDQPFLLHMTSDTPGAFIHYTLDGSEPSEQHGIRYDPNTPLQISTTTVVRSAAIKAGYRPGRTKTATFIFIDDVARQPIDPAGWPDTWGSEPAQYSGPAIPDIFADYEMDPRVVNNTWPGYSVQEALMDIPSISIAMEPVEFIGPADGDGLWANPLMNTEYKCSIEYIPIDGADDFQEDCKVENHGFSSRYPQRMQKHNLRLTFTGEYGASKLNYPLFPDSPVESFNQLILRAFSTDSWALVSWADTRYRPNDSQYIRDVWMKRSLRDMGQPSSYGRYVHLYVNGLYFGLFDLTESVDEAFCEEHFGGEREDWTVGKDFSGVPSYWNTLLNTDVSTLAGYQQSQNYIDSENFADYMLLHFYADAEDWPHHNGIVANNTVSGDGKMRFFVWDQAIVLDNHGLAAGRIDNGNGAGAIFQKMRTSEEFRLLFADRVYKHCFNDGALSISGSQARYLEIASMIDKAIVAESARWGDVQMSTSYGSSISQPSPLDDIHHRLYPPVPNGPDYYFTREESWVVERDNVINNYIPAIHDTNNSYAIVNLFRSQDLYPGFDPPEFLINDILRHGGCIAPGDVLTMNNPDETGTVYYTLDGSDPRLPGGDVNPASFVFSTGQTAVTTTTLVEMSSANWKYLYDGSDQGTAWRAAGFNDAAWGSGPGQLGFGDGDEVTEIGPQVDGRMTAYFRHEFGAADVENIDSVSIDLVYDDGAVIYINNQEVGRVNMPGGVIDTTTPSDGTDGDNAAVTLTGIDSALLNEGSNMIAVEVHQTGSTGTDLSFDLRLNALSTEQTGSPSSEILTQTTQVKARVKSGAEWSALHEAVFADSRVLDALRITEVLYHPADPNTEFVELQNISAADTINLNLVEFTKGVDYTFADVTLAPNEYVLIVQDPTAFAARYGSGLPVAGRYDGRLDNGGERIQYKDAVGTEILDFDYADSWYELTDGYGFSLTVCDPASTDPNDWDRKSGWRSSLTQGGTPGAAAQTALPAGSIVVNELMAHSHNQDSDWIELHNTTEQSINIGGWFLSDDDSDPNNIRKYEIPSDTVIAGGGFHVFEQTTSFGSPSLPPEKRFAFSEGGETVYLYSGADGQVTGFYQAQENFDASETGVTFGRYEKAELSGGYDFTPMLNPTRGSANTGPRIPDIVITEIHYNPSPSEGSDDDYEFVELYNRSGQSVTLMSQTTTETAPGVFITESIPWRLEGTGYEFPNDVVMPAHTYIMVAKNPATYTGLSCDVYGPYDGKLDNGGEQVELQVPGDQEYGKDRYWIPIEKIDYDDEAPWPISPDGNGNSLHRINRDRYGRDYSNWTAGVPAPGS